MQRIDSGLVGQAVGKSPSHKKTALPCNGVDAHAALVEERLVDDAGFGDSAIYIAYHFATHDGVEISGTFDGTESCSTL